MSTWLTLDGSFDNMTPEQIVELRKLMEKHHVTVVDDGSFEFSEECGYSQYDSVLEAANTFGAAHKLAGRMSSYDEQDGSGGERVYDFFGTPDDQNRQMYWHLKHILDEAQRDFDKHYGSCEEKDIARWILEKGAGE